jgi:hypothetical protein
MTTASMRKGQATPSNRAEGWQGRSEQFHSDGPTALMSNSSRLWKPLCVHKRTELIKQQGVKHNTRSRKRQEVSQEGRASQQAATDNDTGQQKRTTPLTIRWYR